MREVRATLFNGKLPGTKKEMSVAAVPGNGQSVEADKLQRAEGRGMLC